MKHCVARLVAGLLVISGLTAAAPAGAQTPPSGASDRDGNRNAAPETHRIGPEDVLHISVWKNETMSRSVPVRPDGKISLPLLNDVQAGGVTALELREVLTKKLAEYMPSPEVSVIVTDVRSFKVSVISEVARPGRYDLKSWATVLDVLALAGAEAESLLASGNADSTGPLTAGSGRARGCGPGWPR